MPFRDIPRCFITGIIKVRRNLTTCVYVCVCVCSWQSLEGIVEGVVEKCARKGNVIPLTEGRWFN